MTEVIEIKNYQYQIVSLAHDLREVKDQIKLLKEEIEDSTCTADTEEIKSQIKGLQKEKRTQAQILIQANPHLQATSEKIKELKEDAKDLAASLSFALESHFIANKTTEVITEHGVIEMDRKYSIRSNQLKLF